MSVEDRISRYNAVKFAALTDAQFLEYLAGWIEQGEGERDNADLIVKRLRDMLGRPQKLREALLQASWLTCESAPPAYRVTLGFIRLLDAQQVHLLLCALRRED